jgi:hypothetical protein
VDLLDPCEHPHVAGAASARALVLHCGWTATRSASRERCEAAFGRVPGRRTTADYDAWTAPKDEARHAIELANTFVKAIEGLLTDDKLQTDH